jgi:hypothetical protein
VWLRSSCVAPGGDGIQKSCYRYVIGVMIHAKAGENAGSVVDAPRNVDVLKANITREVSMLCALAFIESLGRTPR